MQLSSCQGVTLISHKLLQQDRLFAPENDEPICCKEHLVYKEYPKPGGSAALQSKGWQVGNNGMTIDVDREYEWS